jgi:hypothetical protein
VIVGVVVIALIAVGVVVTLLNRAQPAPSVAPVFSPPTVPTTIAYAPRRGPGGATILTEPVDLVTLAIPPGWKSLSADQNTLPDALAKLEGQMPSLASLLQAEAVIAAKAAIRLFAYQPVAPFAFLSVISYSTPSAHPLTPAVVAASVEVSKKFTSGVAVSGVQLPLGEALQLESSQVSQNQHLVSDLLIVVVAGRTVMLQMVSGVTAPGVPTVFSQIAQTLRPS